MLEANVSTGHLPSAEEVRALLVEAYERYRDIGDGAVADYIPALARVSPDLFGVCIVGTDGQQFAVGDSGHPFSMVWYLVGIPLGPGYPVKLGARQTACGVRTCQSRRYATSAWARSVYTCSRPSR